MRALSREKTIWWKVFMPAGSEPASELPARMAEAGRSPALRAWRVPFKQTVNQGGTAGNPVPNGGCVPAFFYCIGNCVPYATKPSGRRGIEGIFVFAEGGENGKRKEVC